MTLRSAALFIALTTQLSAATVGAGFADVVARNVNSVVRILTTRVDTPWANDAVNAAFDSSEKPGPRSKKVSGEGSGVVVSADGYILTNHHVIDRALKITVELNDDRALTATLVASDPATDLAVLKVEASGLQAINYGDSAKLRVGDAVLAIGNPFGVGTTVTSGIVSAMSSSRVGIAGDEDYIQTDAAINPGNSGGPLLNAQGELIGINTAIISPSGGSSGIGFALPSNVARRVMTQLIEKGSVSRGYLGVGLQPMTPNLSEALNLTRPGGAIITDVAPESPAAAAGMQKGDVVMGMNGRVIRDFDRLRLYIAEAQPGATVQLTIAREGKEQVLHATLAEKPTTSVAAAEPAPEVSGEILSGAAVTELTESTRKELGLADGVAGVVVVAVDPEGDSAESGLKAGDVIVVANRKAVADVAGLQKAVDGSKINLLEINRHGGTFFLAVAR